MPQMTLVQAITTALDQEMARDPRVVCLGEDVGVNGGVFRVTEGLQKKYGPERVIDTPLSESGIIGSSIGLAIAGMRPVPEIQFEGFLGPAYDQLVNHAARFRNRTRGAFTVPMVVRVPWGGGIHAPEFHSDSPEAIYAHSPGLKVVCPSTPYDAKGLLISAIRDPDPVIFFEPKRVYRSYREEVPEEEYTIPLGVADIKREGTDVSLIAHGRAVITALKAAEILAAEHGIHAEVLDLRSIRPLDEEAIMKTVCKTHRAVLVDENKPFCGVSAQISSMIMEQCFDELDAPVQRVCALDAPAIYSPALEPIQLPTAQRIIAKTLQIL
jgi:pyruvate dehydrogenase E1 component beta subunit